MKIEKKCHMIDYSYRKVRVKISPLTVFALNEEQSHRKLGKYNCVTGGPLEAVI